MFKGGSWNKDAGARKPAKEAAALVVAASEFCVASDECCRCPSVDVEEPLLHVTAHRQMVEGTTTRPRVPLKSGLHFELSLLRPATNAARQELKTVRTAEEVTD